MSDSAFKVHRLNESGLINADIIADAFSKLVVELDGAGVSFNPRYRALVMTKLEEACFFAKKSMATDPGFQE